MNYEEATHTLETHGQQQLLAFWDQLDASERHMLLADLGSVDWALIREVTQLSSTSPDSTAGGDLTPPSAIPAASPDRTDNAACELRACGERLLRTNRVAVLTVAGGQGTRLGLAGPKGILGITPVRSKSLFQHFAEGILATNRRYRCDLPWYIMTSPENHHATGSFFEQHDFFGLSPERVTFFEQGTMPAFTPDGKLLLAERHRLALAPDGHGGVLRALRRSGCLSALIREGRKWVSFFQVDNPLIAVADPGFLGAAELLQSEAVSKVVRKRDEQEKAGVFALQDGKLRVIEYSMMPERLAGLRNADGALAFDLANIAAHVFNVSFIDRLTGDDSDFRLPWNRANKKIVHVDPHSGQRKTPDAPNAIKLEQFIFDAIALANNPVLYEVKREEEFSPVKNNAGQDSPDTARSDLTARARRWLQSAGRLPAGPPPRAIEISPLFALDAAELSSRLDAAPHIEPDSTIYLGP